MDASSITLIAFSAALILTTGSFIAVVNYRARCVKQEETPVVTVNTVEIKMPDWR